MILENLSVLGLALSAVKGLKAEFQCSKLSVFSYPQGKIITLEKFGMLVSVSEHIRGLCTTLHLADIQLKHPEKKLKQGKVVKCRVNFIHVLFVWRTQRVSTSTFHDVIRLFYWY